MAGKGHFSADPGTRGGSSAEFSASASSAQRGGTGAEQQENVLSSSIPGNPHSSRGFRRALMKTSHSGNKLKDMVKGDSFSGKGFRKPSYFAQGGARHGLHIGSGSPATIPAEQTGASTGGGQ